MLKMAVCEDNPKYADGCPTFAAVENYCEDNEDFMRKNCPKSCRYCSQGDLLKCDILFRDKSANWNFQNSSI